MNDGDEILILIRAHPLEVEREARCLSTSEPENQERDGVWERVAKQEDCETHLVLVCPFDGNQDRVPHE